MHMNAGNGHGRKHYLIWHSIPINDIENYCTNVVDSHLNTEFQIGNNATNSCLIIMSSIMWTNLKNSVVIQHYFIRIFTRTT